MTQAILNICRVKLAGEKHTSCCHASRSKGLSNCSGMFSLKPCMVERKKTETRWNVAFACLPFFLQSIYSADLLSFPLSVNELQFNCWTPLSVAMAVMGR